MHAPGVCSLPSDPYRPSCWSSELTSPRQRGSSALAHPRSPKQDDPAREGPCKARTQHSPPVPLTKGLAAVSVDLFLLVVPPPPLGRVYLAGTGLRVLCLICRGVWARVF